MLEGYGFILDRKTIRKIATVVCRLVIFSAVIVWICTTAGCKTTDKGSRNTLSGLMPMEYNKVEGGGWITLFMNLKEPFGPKVVFKLSSLEVGSGGNWNMLRQSPLLIDASQIGAKQIFIARNGLPQGRYDKLRFVIETPLVIQDGVEMPLSMAQTTLTLDLPAKLNLSEDDSHSLFVTWDVEKSLTGPEIFAPEMHVNLQAIPLIKDLIFVACPELNTIYVIRTDKNWVISSIGVSGKPTYLEVDPQRNQLYVLAADESFIKVIDLTAYKIIDKYYIPMDFGPDYMFTDAEIRYAFLLDERGKSITKVDLLNGDLLGKETLIFYPRYGVNLAGQGKLAVSASDMNQIYFFNPDTLLNTGSIPVGNKPQGILGLNAVIFVAESGSHTITAYNVRDGRQINKVRVGYSPMRLFLKGNQLYATNLQSGSVTVMLPRQLIVSGEVRVGGEPLEIAGSQNRRWLYVGDVQNGGLSVIDSTSNRINQFIELQTQPMGLAVVD
jgi:DNA-binding beta-propeller fold protein YncE